MTQFIPVQFNDSLIKLNQTINDLGIKYLPIANIFKKDDAPYLVVGKSGSGKSILCNNIISCASKINDDKMRIFYFSCNEDNINEMNKIKNVIAKKLTFENLNYFWNMIKTDDGEYNTILQQEISTEQFNSIKYRNILLIDDINEIFGDVLSECEHECKRSRIRKYPPSPNYPPIIVPVSKTIHSLLVDIFTESRRFNCLTVVFARTWSTIDIKSQLKNFIIMDSETAETLNVIKSVSNDKTREIVREVFIELSKWLYNLIVIKDNEVFITKCEL